MANVFRDVEKFMIASNQTTDYVNEPQSTLYFDLVEEELAELYNSPEDTEDQLDAICDSIWVLIGLAYSKGYDIEAAFKEVARSNMSKIDPKTQTVLKRDDGKVLKPPHFSPPYLTPYLS
jgi:predicted HAD superfamily Cof-like phosphohydrolase